LSNKNNDNIHIDVFHGDTTSCSSLC